MVFAPLFFWCKVVITFKEVNFEKYIDKGGTKLYNENMRYVIKSNCTDPHRKYKTACT